MFLFFNHDDNGDDNNVKDESWPWHRGCSRQRWGWRAERSPLNLDHDHHYGGDDDGGGDDHDDDRDDGGDNDDDLAKLMFDKPVCIPISDFNSSAISILSPFLSLIFWQNLKGDNNKTVIL